MSILLDAVTRAKQQSSDINLDPVLTPRAQYKQLSKTQNKGLLVLLTVIILTLLVVIAWISRDQPPESVTDVTIEPQAVELVVPAMAQNHVAQDEELNLSRGGIQLAGKVALPIASIMPMRYQEPTEPKSVSASVSRSPASFGDQAVSEPIILGANANHKGQELLASLKYQVDSAAEDLGLSYAASKPVAESEPKTKLSPSQSETSPRDYQSEGNLLAAFEAALKEIEISKSVATPVTEPKLDPIPTPQQDTLPKYGQLPAGLQLQVPEFSIKAHVYASDPNNRWLNVDGAELQQGDTIGGKLEIIEIRPRDVVLSIQGTKFKVPAI
ncbi:general secretion pathway protein GspB [Shewanella sp. D64]|uniref:general secretion pathway protein GspB n=1 Tax=unclassified Shewanella TaxID=196818 RepID=UPI0022BA4A0E|nr:MULTISPECIES: general secretion pathway protein GspB [unclassified Shewanella]MEC4726668.1 general secretion pathway protein GspB [Shewanella sp. D64]MEC4738968.1 general secretion pathway protein GspB [Shewanella sp. E94]WBJ96883.1 general secretion pathway protein GspB [Shewanella sp. MTB7]